MYRCLIYSLITYGCLLARLCGIRAALRDLRPCLYSTRFFEDTAASAEVALVARVLAVRGPLHKAPSFELVVITHACSPLLSVSLPTCGCRYV